MNARTSRLSLSLAAFSLTLGAVFALFAGCGLSTGGIPSADAGTACTGVAQCDDQDPCTVDACDAQGICTHTAQADGPAPASAQVVGDCLRVDCASGEPSTVTDDTDVPPAPDMCTATSCTGGKPAQMPAPDGATCALMGVPGTCAAGVCTVACKNASDCPSGGPCKVATCDGAKGVCTFANVSDGTPTPGQAQIAGDCHVHICVGGADVDLEDDSDVPPVPAALTGCADGLCTAGVPSNPLHATDSPCSTFMGSQPGACDATGACVQCVTNTDCSGPTDDCQHPACVGAMCTVAFTTAGTATSGNPAQVPGDCHKLVCLGSVVNMLDYQPVVDDTDVPVSGTACLTDTCSGGNVVQAINAGVMCGGTIQMPELCTAQGQCGCQNSSDCVLPNTCGGGGTPLVCGCTPTTCAALGKTCGGPFADACFATLGCDDGMTDGTETDIDCGGSTTTCATRCDQGRKCMVGTDCKSGFCADGVCCNVACAGNTCQACSTAAKGQGADGVCGAVIVGQDPHNDCPMQAVSTCGQSGGCNGSGACSKYPSGTVCQDGTCAGTVLTKAETCANGVCTAPSPKTQDCAPSLCSSGACSSGNCASDADCAATAYCKTGMCAPRIPTGMGCTAADQCQTGFCTDGFCCNMACTAACMGCSHALTKGANGTCGPVGGGPDPRMLCAKTAMTSCGTDGNCAAGACEDWAGNTGCSATSCSGSTLTTYTKCNGSGSCSNMFSGVTMAACPMGYRCATMTACATSCGSTPGTSTCQNHFYCDGVGAGTCHAQGGPGANCTTNYQCLSGTCFTNGHCT